jgi:hypothetical protein
MRGNQKVAERECIVAPTPMGRPGQADARTIARRGDPVNRGPGTSGRLSPGRIPPCYLNAGITSRAKRARFSFMIFLGVPSGHETMMCSSPGYRCSTPFR